MKYVIIGSAIDGNKGAASMLEASLQTISERDTNAEFTLLSMYPASDRELNTHSNLEILPAKPLQLGVVINSLALLYKILPPLRPLLRKHRAIKAISGADAYLDQGGITFVDGREVFLIYNIASILPALFIDTPVVKCSQAMGPFKSRVNRFFAKLFLPHVTQIYARGQKTFDSLKRLKLNNVELVSDYAFSMEITKAEAKVAKQLLKNHSFNDKLTNIGVFPSEVLRKKAEKRGQAYEKVIAEFIDELTKKPDTHVYLLPHSQKHNSEGRHNNDLPVCRDIYEKVKNKKACTYIEDPTTPQQLRNIIGHMDMNVVARFHAMVSSLAVETPALVTGWSHKYQEVLDMFELNGCAFDVSDLSADRLLNQYEEVYKRRSEIQDLIKKNLTDVKISSIRQADGIVDIARGE